MDPGVDEESLNGCFCYFGFWIFSSSFFFLCRRFPSMEQDEEEGEESVVSGAWNFSLPDNLNRWSRWIRQSKIFPEVRVV